MHPLPPISADQRGVFTTRQAADTGWTESALAWAVRSRRLTRLAHGTYVPSNALLGSSIGDRRRVLVIRAIAAQLSVRGAVISHASAAAMADLPLLRMPVKPCITVRPGYTGDAASAHLHRASLQLPAHVCLPTDAHVFLPTEGIRRTTTARTVVDIAREDGVDEAVVVGDAALHRGLTTLPALQSVIAHCATWPGIVRGRETVGRLDGLAESPLESISRLRIMESTLPPPCLQRDLYDSSGRWLARTDFLWDEAGVVGEADGLEKYDDTVSRPLRREKIRQETLERTGLIVVRWGWSDLANPLQLTGRISEALRKGARRPYADRGWLIAADG